MKGVGDRFYFSFSSIFCQKLKNIPEVIKSCPEDRLLIESDWSSAGSMDREVLKMCKFISKQKDWSLHKTARITYQNAVNFYELEN